MLDFRLRVCYLLLTFLCRTFFCKYLHFCTIVNTVSFYTQLLFFAHIFCFKILVHVSVQPSTLRIQSIWKCSVVSMSSILVTDCCLVGHPVFSLSGNPYCSNPQTDLLLQICRSNSSQRLIRCQLSLTSSFELLRQSIND